jgi:nucleoside-diphosphate-sugar epimerase
VPVSELDMDPYAEAHSAGLNECLSGARGQGADKGWAPHRLLQHYERARAPARTRVASSHPIISKVTSTQEMEKAMRIVVTGAAGNIGKAVMAELEGDFDIVALGRTAAPGIVQVDLSDFGKLLPLFKDVETVVHLAADPRAHVASWDIILRDNVVATRNVYEAARLQGVRRVVFASSHMATIGWESVSPWCDVLAGAPPPEGFRPLDETTPYRPNVDYAMSKAWGEIQGRMYSEQFGLSVIALRILWCTRDGIPPAGQEALWLSHRDAARAIRCAITAPMESRFRAYYIVSNNRNRIWDLESATRELGWVPLDGV